jgi:hypothetical protein
MGKIGKTTLTVCICLLMSCKTQVVNQSVNGNIILINTGVNNRIGISKELQKINSLKPKVIGIDLQFSSVKNLYEDSLLMAALGNCRGLVLARIIDGYSAQIQYILA